MNAPLTHGHKLVLEPLPPTGGVVALRGHPGSALGHRPVVVFNSVSVPADQPEFFAATSTLGRPVLFLTDVNRTWFASRETARRTIDLIRAELDRCEADSFDTIGFSKGGYAALAVAADLPVRRALSFAPRFTVDPGIVFDPRRRPSIESLSGKFHHPTVATGLARIQGGLILHGAWGFDLRHVVRMPPSNAQHWLIRTRGHFVTTRLRNRNLMHPLVRAVLADNRPEIETLLLRAGAVRRRTPEGRRLLAVSRALTALYLTATLQNTYDWKSRRAAHRGEPAAEET